MSDGCAVGFDGDVVAAAVPLADDVRDCLRGLHDRLADSVGEFRAAAGGDGSGARLQESVVPAAQKLAEALKISVDVMGGVGQGLATMRRGYERGEQNNTDGIRRVLRPGDSGS